MLDTPILSEPVSSNSADSQEMQGPRWLWFVGCLCLAVASLFSGSPNCYPAKRQEFIDYMGVSKGLASFTLTGGVMLMYITLPAGIFMDKFGATLTLFCSIGICIVGYIGCILSFSITWLFITSYFVMAFGSASIFIAALQIVLSRAPNAIKGLSTSIVSASLSLSVGICVQIFSLGPSMFGSESYRYSFTAVGIFVCCFILVASIGAFFCYRKFSEGGSQPGTRAVSVLFDYRLYVLIVCMFMTVFDGLLMLTSGEHIFAVFGKPGENFTWITPFSVINCVMTIVISAILDLILAKTNIPRTKLCGFFWIGFIIFPGLVAIVFSTSTSSTALGIVMACMGIPFGFGLTHIPALTSEIFGNDKYGFAFGFVQIGSITAAAITMVMMDAFRKTGIVITFCAVVVLHLCIGFIMIFVVSKRKDGYKDVTDLSQ